MSFKKSFLIVSALIIFSFFFSFNTVFAETMTAAEMQTLIQQLQAQIAVLQQQLSQTQGAPAAWCHDFNVNLKIGDAGDEVSALQTVLMKEGFQIIRGETQIPNFGEYTASAVTGFQEKYKDEVLTPLGLKYGTGYVGKSTRAKLNALYGCGVSTLTPTPVPMPIPTPTSTSTATTTPSITVISPNGGEAWYLGRTHRVSWNSSNVNSVKIYIYDSNIFGSGSTNYITPNNVSVSAALGYYDWTIGYGQLPISSGGNNWRIRVQDANDANIQDSSDAPFSISATTTPVGSLIYHLDPTTPMAQNATTGTSNFTFLVASLAADLVEDIKVNSIRVSVYRDGTTTPAQPGDLTNLKLYEGSTQIGPTQPTLSSGIATFSDLNWVIPRGYSKTLRIKADIPATVTATALQVGIPEVGIPEGGAISGVGISSGAPIYAIGSAMGMVMTITPPTDISNIVPEMVYPINGQALNYGLPHGYMFKVKPIAGATGYRYQFIQNGLLAYESTESTDGEFALWPGEPGYSSLAEGDVAVEISALSATQSSRTRTITIKLAKPTPSLACMAYVRYPGTTRMVQGSWITNASAISSIQACYNYMKQNILDKPNCAQGPDEYGVGGEYVTIVLIPQSKKTYDMPEINMSTEYVTSQYCSTAGISTTTVCASYFRKTGTTRMIQGTWNNDLTAASSTQACYNYMKQNILDKLNCAQPDGEYITIALIPESKHTYDMPEIDNNTEFVTSQYCATTTDNATTTGATGLRDMENQLASVAQAILQIEAMLKELRGR